MNCPRITMGQVAAATLPRYREARARFAGSAVRQIATAAPTRPAILNR